MITVNLTNDDRDKLIQDIIHHINLMQASGNNNIEQGGNNPIRLAKITRTENNKNRVFIKFFGEDLHDKSTNIEAVYTGFMGSSDGAGFWHGLTKGDTVQVINTQADKYVILNKLSGISSVSLNNLSMQQTASPPGVENLPEGSYAIRTRLERGFGPSKLMTIEAIPGVGINLGLPPFSSIKFDYFTDTADSTKYDSAYSLASGQKYEITEGGYNIEGIILRTPERSGNRFIDVRNQENWYSNLQPVCLDPSRNRVDNTENDTRIKNPPFVEKREIVYEFAESSYVESDNIEMKKQNPQSFQSANEQSISRKNKSRRNRKNDVLSLSLVSPNFLIESIKGTVVDVYGNVLDLNRNRLPIGKNELASLDGTENSFKTLKEQHRRGLAFHWELNAKKDTREAPIDAGTGKEYAKTNNTYTRERRRFFFDIDKEGQFKLIVPASSEIGNVGLPVNYENISTINAIEDEHEGNNYDTFVSPKEGQQDIVFDSFGKGCVSLIGSEKLIPIDRITGNPIKLGTVFHDISKTCCEPAFIDPVDIGLGAAIFAGPDTILESVVSKEINLDGPNANAGGRSGTFIFDGMLNISIGANSVDRQSLWFDTEGGIVSRIGRDKNDISMLSQLDGDYYLQIGGNTIGDDKRFLKDGFEIDANRNPTFEVRLIDGNNNYHRINIDQHGILLRSSGDIRLETKDNIVLHAAKIVVNCEIEEKYSALYDLEIWKRVKMYGLIARLIASTDVYSDLGSDTA